MTRYLNVETWNRRQQFEFFKDFDNPFFNVCANVDVTSLLRLTRAAESISFFIAYHFLSVKAANDIEPFRYRIRGERVLVHERIHAGTTVLLADERFTFAYFEYDEDFQLFHARAKAVVERLRGGENRFDPRAGKDDLVHHSVLPWVSFTGISHARNFGQQDSIPKIAFGKYFEDGNRTKMPVSVETHHALMDGLHVGRYFERLQSYLSDPRAALNLSTRQ